MKRLLFQTPRDAGLTLIRVALAVVIFPHGAQKLLGWFGGYGWSGTMGWLTGTMHVPALFAALAILAESLGALGLLTGLLGRVAAFGVLCNMVVAVWMVHSKVGFFMNWNMTAGRGEGFEYHLLVMAMALLIIWKGSGAYSVDRVVAGGES
ncbi:MAG TPA: DoxX family protein [Gemmatimonadales bacterium]|nr:DoxX family protein [Gemmatimonadales bacterium]